MKRLLILVALMTASACGGSGLNATSTAQIAGNWTGTMETANLGSQAVSVTMTQAGTAVTGTWSGNPIAWQGVIAGTVDSKSFTGTFTFSGTTSTGTVCTADGSFSGSASTTAQTLQWTSAGFIGGACPALLPTTIVLNLQRVK